MSALSIFSVESNQLLHKTVTDFPEISTQLAKINVQFERWQADHEFSLTTDSESIIAAYQTSINKLKNEFGFQSVDVINVYPDHPNKAQLRQKFLAEHTHDDFEVRFFVYGRGLFYLHVENKIYVVLCDQGDLISVPSDTLHWFDMGENPDFKCIRLFTNPDGWIANFSGTNISENFPSFDQYLATL